MPGRDNDNHVFCPHCGTENAPDPDAWINGMDHTKPIFCVNCQKSLFSGHLDDGHAVNWNFKLRFFIIAFLLAGLVVYLNRIFGVLTLKEDTGQVFYEVMLIVIVSSALSSGKVWQNFKYLAIWAGIFIVLISGYSYRHELLHVKEKIMAEVIPARGFQKTPDSISFPVSSDGHFYIRAQVDGTPVLFLADTGASHIVLSPADAEKLGIKVDALSFNRFFETANGTVRGSSIRIADLLVGDIHLKDIGATVNEVGMGHSLLGMTFFNRLERYEVKNSVLTLYWRG